jgi:hypothetical protein
MAMPTCRWLHERGLLLQGVPPEASDLPEPLRQHCVIATRLCVTGPSRAGMAAWCTATQATTSTLTRRTALLTLNPSSLTEVRAGGGLY